jgi:hypothetical protein
MAGTQRYLGKLAALLTRDRPAYDYELETTDTAQHFGGVAARGADLAALEQAKKQAESGTPMREVWHKYGWYQAPWDSKWRTWLDHRDTDFSEPASRIFPELQTVDNNSRIYKNYPQIRDASVVAYISPELGPLASGAYNYSDKSVMIEAGTEEAANSAGYHELEHAIQDIEGFSKGTNLSGALITKAINSLKQHHPKKYINLIQQYGSSVEEETARKLYSLPGGVEEKIARDLYLLNGGEAEARLAQLWMKLSPEEIRKRYPLDEIPANIGPKGNPTDLSTVPKASPDLLWGEHDTADKLADILLRLGNKK